MEERINFFVDSDAHKDSISIAACEAGREAARFLGAIGPDVRGLFKILDKAGAGQRRLRGRPHPMDCIGSCCAEATGARSSHRR